MGGEAEGHPSEARTLYLRVTDETMLSRISVGTARGRKGINGNISSE